MATFSKYLTAKNSSVAGGILLALYLLKRRRRAAHRDGRKGGSDVLNEKEGRKDRAAVDKVFFSRIFEILRILVPRLVCKEVGH